MKSEYGIFYIIFRNKIRKYIELKDNKNTIDQNKWNAAKDRLITLEWCGVYLNEILESRTIKEKIG